MTERFEKNRDDFKMPPSAALEFTAAIEAATGLECIDHFSDPMRASDLKEALGDLLICPRPDRGLDALRRSGVLEAILPEIAALFEFGEGIRHKDVWMHTKKVIIRTPPRLAVRWAGMLHDIGKVPTRRFESNGQVTFWGHPEVGAQMFDRIARRFAFDKSLSKHVRFLIAAHLRASAYDDTWTDSAVRRFARTSDAYLEDLLDLSRADITSKHAEKVEQGIRQINRLAERVRKLALLDAKPKPLPTGLGTEIIAHFGIEPGPRLGEVMRFLAEQVENGHLGGQEDFTYYLAFIKQNPSVLANLQKTRSKS